MSRRERVRYEMLLRIRDFGLAHGELFTKSLSGQLDVVVRNVAGRDAAVLAAWERDLRIVDGIGKRKVVHDAAQSAPAEIAETTREGAQGSAAPDAESSEQEVAPLRKVS